MRIFFFLLFCPVLAYADVVVDVDTLYAVNDIDAEAVKIYRIEITNDTDSDRLFFVAPQQCDDKSANEKFKSFLRQEVFPGWRMKHIIYEGNAIYDSKRYSQKNLLKTIPPGETFVILLMNNANLETVLDRIVTIKTEDVRTILKADLREDLIYPYPEAVWPSY